MKQHQYSICRELFDLSRDAELVEVPEHGLALVVLHHIALLHAAHPSHVTQYQLGFTKTDRTGGRGGSKETTYHFKRHAGMNLINCHSKLVLNALHLKKTIECERLAVSTPTARRGRGAR